MNSDYPRDLIGYGPTPPHAKWPDNARIAVQFVLNYEEGGENNVLHGDEHSEQFLSEIIGALPYKDRHMSMESIYEYGSRVGVWRILREFERRNLPLTVFAVATALQRHRDLTSEFQRLGHEIACHGLKWIHYQNIEMDTEREHMREAVEIFQEFFGYLKDAFDVLYKEGEETPKMMSIGLHCRLAGRPGRFAALQRFLDHIEQHEHVWICRRVDIAKHWYKHHPFHTS